MMDSPNTLRSNVVLDEVESTNDYARSLGESGAAHGTWISAREQTSGRGRQGREWKSVSGNLFLSVVLRPDRDFPLTWIPLGVALGVHRTAQHSRPDLDLVLKWPNDLGLRDEGQGFRKIGGILCEGVGGANGSFVIAGIGVNCATAPQTDQATAALEVDVDSFRESVLREILAVFTDPVDRIRAEYARVSLLRNGDPIEWSDLRDSVSRSGTFFGYGSHGELLVDGQIEDQGKSRRHSLFSEEIRLKKKPVKGSG
jgi:biotin-[acetyl-CoA-carboxylase] ligase BirA-like protein